MGLDPGTRIQAHALLTTWLGVSGLLFFFHAVSRRFPAILGLELILFCAPWVALFWEHREGHLGRPWGVLEPAWALGFGTDRVLAAMGLGLGILSVFLIAARLSGRLSLSLVVGACGLSVACFFLVPERTVIDSPTPDRTTAGTAQRDEQRQDRPVASVVFSQNYEPEQGTYYFRSLDSPSSARIFGDAESTRTLEYRVAEMATRPLRLCLGEPEEVRQPQLLDPDPFTRIYDIRSQVSTLTIEGLLRQDLSIDSLEPKGETGRLAAEIVPPKERRNPLLAALRIKFWLQRERRQTYQQTDLKAFLTQGQPGDQETFARAAQALLSSLGISTRLVHGYAVRSDQRGEGSSLLITEKHHRWWNELWLARGGWVVIDVMPLDAPSDQRPGPHDLGLQRQLGELARKARADSPHLLPGFGAGALGILIFLGVVCLGGYAIKLYRLYRGNQKSAQTAAFHGYRMILDRLAEVGELREPGETRRDFALRLKDRLPSLENLTLFHLKAHFDRSGAEHQPHWDTHLVQDVLREFRTAYPTYQRVLGSLHPFSWMKVH